MRRSRCRVSSSCGLLNLRPWPRSATVAAHPMWCRCDGGVEPNHFPPTFEEEWFDVRHTAEESPWWRGKLKTSSAINNIVCLSFARAKRKNSWKLIERASMLSSWLKTFIQSCRIKESNSIHAMNLIYHMWCMKWHIVHGVSYLTCNIWYIIYAIWYVTYHIWSIIYDISYVMYHVWHIISDISYTIYYIWYAIFGISWMRYPVWYLIYDISYMMPIYYLLRLPVIFCQCRAVGRAGLQWWRPALPGADSQAGPAHAAVECWTSQMQLWKPRR